MTGPPTATGIEKVNGWADHAAVNINWIGWVDLGTFAWVLGADALELCHYLLVSTYI